MEAWSPFLIQAGNLLGQAVTSGQEQALRAYVAELTQWNQRFNLVGPGGMANLLTRHLLDSLRLAPVLSGRERVADLGSGAGLPGLILAICGDPGQTMDLVESIQKKSRFLKHMVNHLGLDSRVRVLNVRAESLFPDVPYDAIISRALGNLALGARLALPLLRVGGDYVTLKGRRHAEDVADYLQDPVSRAFAPPQIVALGEEGVLIRVQRVQVGSEKKMGQKIAPKMQKKCCAKKKSEKKCVELQQRKN